MKESIELPWGLKVFMLAVCVGIAIGIGWESVKFGVACGLAANVFMTIFVSSLKYLEGGR